MIQELNDRSREIFRRLVEEYMETGQPVGSRTISRRIDGRLSPASIRNVMSDLEDCGLIFAPHTSAGRLPTEAGMRMFVDGLLELGNLTSDERASIEGRCVASGRSLQDVLTEASGVLSGLSRCAGLVLAPKDEGRLKHIEFVSLGAGRALVVTVSESGLVENRVIETATGMGAEALVEASNYLNARLRGRSIADARQDVLSELTTSRAEIDRLTKRLIEDGLATWSGGEGPPSLIVSGRSNLLDDVHAIADLERVRKLLDELESKQALLRLMEQTQIADGVRIFIGAESNLFTLSGCSMIVAPYRDSRRQIVGAIGVIGPTRLNYARIIPMVDYTAQVVSRLIG